MPGRAERSVIKLHNLAVISDDSTFELNEVVLLLTPLSETDRLDAQGQQTLQEATTALGARP